MYFKNYLSNVFIVTFVDLTSRPNCSLTENNLWPLDSSNNQ